MFYLLNTRGLAGVEEIGDVFTCSLDLRGSAEMDVEVGTGFAPKEVFQNIEIYAGVFNALLPISSP